MTLEQRAEQLARQVMERPYNVKARAKGEARILEALRDAIAESEANAAAWQKVAMDHIGPITAADARDDIFP
jgi:hypothetical protein